MNLILLLPAALAALAALALPLLLHLARRQQQTPTVFAALRWLRANPKPRRRIRFDEWWLLAVRLLLVALLAVLLARPALLGVEDARPRLLVVPGVAALAIAEATTHAGNDLDARWLAPGFPAIDQPMPQGAFATASLLREFDATLTAATPLAVLVPERLHGADAARLRLVREVDWRVAPAGGVHMQVARVPAPVVAIRHDDAHREGVRYLRAAALAWEGGETGADVETSDNAANALPTDAQVLAWLRSDPLPPTIVAWVEQGGQVLLADDTPHPAQPSATVAWRDAAGHPLLTTAAMGKGRVLRFARPLQPRAMPELLGPGFAAQLRNVLQPAAAPALVAAIDYAPEAGAIASPASPRDLRPWLALAIALLALIERWMATSPRRNAAA